VVAAAIVLVRDDDEREERVVAKEGGALDRVRAVRDAVREPEARTWRIPSTTPASRVRMGRRASPETPATTPAPRPDIEIVR
jgi:hypothetical protein